MKTSYWRKGIGTFLALVLAFSLAACQKQDGPENKEESAGETSQTQGKENTTGAKDGLYHGKAQGHNGLLELDVTLKDGKITAITVTKNEETEHVAKIPLEEIPKAMIEHQSTKVDTVAGATVTSAALRSAVEDALKTGGVDLALFSKEIPKEKSTEHKELSTDVVIVGGGGSGMSAALTAQQHGLKVIVLEKTATLGGHTAVSGGFALVTGSDLQKKMGVTDDTLDLVYEDNFKNGGEKSVPELLKLYCQQMGPTTDWTVDYVEAGIPDTLTPLSENQVDRALIYEGAGKGLSDALEKKLRETPAEIYLNTRATKLNQEGDRIVSVEAQAVDGTTYTITGKAIVLATGSYGARKDLLPDSLKNYVFYGAGLASGDGLEMGQEVGADTVNMGYVELFENGVEWKPGIAKSTYNGSMAAWDKSGILVDRTGKRVVNERGPGIKIVEQMAKQEDGRLFLLMDQATFEHFEKNVGGYGISQDMLDGWLEKNASEPPFFAHGDSLDEVAKLVDVDPAGLKETLERYNGFVEAKKDEDFARPADYLQEKIGQGPYYLVEQKPRYATTLGGLRINDRLQVLNKDAQVIPGLYAVGDTAGGVRGNDSIPGADVGWAITSGYTVGQILAEDLAEK